MAVCKHYIMKYQIYEKKAHKMDDAEKFCFKLKLEIGLLTTKEIQDWANEEVLKNNQDEFTLDICFMKSEEDVREYFNQLSYVDLNLNRQKIAVTILKEYLLEKYPLNLNTDIEQYLSDINFITKHIIDDELLLLLNIYEAQIDLAYTRTIQMTVNEAFDMYLYLSLIHI